MQPRTDYTPVKRGANLLLQGATLTDLSCPVCSSPLFRLKDGSFWCAKDEKKVIERFDRQFDFLPSGGGLLTLTYGIPAFFAYGWTEKRMKEIVAGSRLTEDESIIFLWAYTIVDMILYTDRVEGSQDEIEFIREAVDIAEEYLSNESAVYVVNRIRVLVENKNNGKIG